MKHDRTWDIRRLLSDFIQETGRGVRSKDDWAVTYVFDENLRKEVRRYKKMLPGYFLAAIQNLEG
jgi:Rad3-related DNA helicase